MHSQTVTDADACAKLPFAIEHDLEGVADTTGIDVESGKWDEDRGWTERGMVMRDDPRHSFGASNGHHDHILFPQWSEQYLSNWKCIAFRNDWRTISGVLFTVGGRSIERQPVRAADSIGATIAEGAGRTTSLDNCRFIRIARGSLHETGHWLRRAARRGMLHQADIDIMRDLLDTLSPRLNAYLRAVQTRTPCNRQQ